MLLVSIVVVLLCGMLLGHVQRTRGPMVVGISICVQLLAAVALLLNGPAQRQLAAFLVGAVLGAAIESVARRRRAPAH